MKKEIRLYFIHTFDGKDLDHALSLLCLEELKSEFSFVYTSDNPDYLVASEHIYYSEECSLEFQRLYSKAKVKIFFAGEAVSPDFNLFDYAVGYDGQLSNGERYCQLPTPDEVLGKSFLSKSKNDIETLEQAKEELSKKTGFCNFLYSNPNSHFMRDKLFYDICSYKHVDSLGRHLNNVEKEGTGHSGHSMECVPMKSAYKFSIASENARFPGYTSEKLLTSLEAHTVPIYWGDPMVITQINPDCIINANEHRTKEDLIAKVREVDENEDLWCKMVAAPWRTPEQERYRVERNERYVNYFRSIFEKSIEAAKVLPEGTHPWLYRNRQLYTFGCWNKPSTLGKIKLFLLGWKYKK